MKTLSIELQLDIQALLVKMANVNTLAPNPRATLLALKLEAQILKRRCIAELEAQ